MKNYIIAFFGAVTVIASCSIANIAPADAPPPVAAAICTWSPDCYRLEVRDVNDTITTTTLGVDTSLTLDLGKNEVWLFQAVFMVRGSSTSDMKIGVDIPPLGATIVWGRLLDGAQFNESHIEVVQLPNATPFLVVLTGMVITTVDPGKLEIKRALNSGSNPLIILSGTHLRAYKIIGT